MVKGVYVGLPRGREVASSSWAMERKNYCSMHAEAIINVCLVQINCCYLGRTQKIGETRCTGYKLNETFGILLTSCTNRSA